MDIETFALLKNPIIRKRSSEESLNKLRISFDYQKCGSINILNGEYETGGVYVYLMPCRNENGITSTVWDGKTHTMGYKICLKEMSRKSQKQIEIAASRIIPKAQEIADLYCEYKYKEVYELIMKTYNNI